MANPIRIPGVGMQPVQVDPTKPLPPRPATTTPPTRPFSEVLAETVTEVQRLQNEADNTIKQLVAGEIKDVGEAMIAVEKADMAFQTMLTVRNRMITAYEEIMRMQI